MEAPARRRLERFLLIAGDILREEELAIWMQFNPDAAQDPRRRRRSRAPPPRARQPAMALHRQPRRGPHLRRSRPRVRKVLARHRLDAHHRPDRQEHLRLARAALAANTAATSAASTRFPTKNSRLLADRGINSLWLIGVWERSRASKTIKQLCGNHDAVASAYSLFDYRIADDLGGEPAYINLRDRAYRHGIRLASDMVPNHMGIDSPWVVEHPDWFISRWESPYPAYSFNGPDLSTDGRVEIKIDDHYYEQTDAAVVFRRRDKSTGETRYIYHGNDGTSFPWNDTAQLDYLNPAVREQVIQTILHVARLFPVIRFDAAMTLAKRHFQRLWFPGPGTSGAIPSRAEYAMSAGGIRSRSCRTSSGAKSSIASPPKSPARCCSPKPSGSWKATSSAPSACIASTTAPS